MGDSASPGVKTTCPYCGVGCGLAVSRQADGSIVVRGDDEHPANHGRLCSKGAALGETLGLDGRLLHPRIAGRRVSWDEALEHVAGGLRRVIDRHGPDAVAFYVSGQLLTEDYYVANKLMKGFIGSANIDTNSRLCMSSSVAGHKRAFGSDTVPCSYQDLELADLVVLVGSNAAWCHPVLFQRIRAARERRPEMKVVVVDPRRTATCDIADLHLALKPGSDVALFNGLLLYLHAAGRLDHGFIDRCTSGYDEALAAAAEGGWSDPVEASAASCELPAHDVQRFYAWFTERERTVTLYSQGVNQWSCGTDKVTAILNVHLATGRIGRNGMGPFSLTGQPNAMGGREVGGLANQLAAHMDFRPADVQRVSRFWDAPSIARKPGLKAVDLWDAVAEGRIKAVWVMATNPAVSMPAADRVRAALRGCDLVVVSDCVERTDTNVAADVLLPAAAWGEKDGTVTNSERRISRQRAFLELPGEARPDWWILSQVARRMGHGESFSYRDPSEIFSEHAALSGFENNGARDFDISGLTGLGAERYASLRPVQWPVTAASEGGTPRMFGSGRYFNADARARFLPVSHRGPATRVDHRYPLVLNTGRVRDQWHTMTRTGTTPRLTAHVMEPFVQVHPVDAAAWQLQEGGLATVSSRQGMIRVRVRVSDEQRPGSVFVPMHWSEQFARLGRVGALVTPELDPVSGQPEFKHTPVHVAPYRPAWHGFLLSRASHSGWPDSDYAVKAIAAGHWRYELAGDKAPGDWPSYARGLLGAEGEWLEYQDVGLGAYRGALIRNGRLQACLFVAGRGGLPEREWVGSLFDPDELAAADRASLLAGRAGPGRGCAGRTICACFNVGIGTIVAAIENDGLVSVDAIGGALKAGTNCGSCVPELRTLLAAHGQAAA